MRGSSQQNYVLTLVLLIEWALGWSMILAASRKGWRYVKGTLVWYRDHRYPGFSSREGEVSGFRCFYLHMEN